MIRARGYLPLRSGGALASRWRNPIALAALLLLAGAVLTVWMLWPAPAESHPVAALPATSPPTLALNASPSRVTLNEGQSINFRLAVSGTPTGDVSVAITSSDTSAVKPAFSSALFTPSHTGPYLIPLLGVNDSDIDDETVTITATASGGGLDSASDTVTVSVTDSAVRKPSAPTLTLRPATPRWAPGSIEGDLNWTAGTPKLCRINQYEIHYKKSSVSAWPAVTDTADADSGVHVINLDSQHHGADVLWVWVKLGTGSQPKLDKVQYDVRLRVNGPGCSVPSDFSSVAKGTPHSAAAVPVPTPEPQPGTPQDDDFDGETLAIKHVTADSTACLDVSYARAADGQDVWTWDCNNTDAQKWKFEKRTSGAYKDSYRLVSQVGDGATYCLDNRGAFTTSDQMGIWSCVGDTDGAAANQSVTVAASGSGYTLTFSNGSRSVWLVTDRASSNPKGGANQTTVSGTAGASAIWTIE